MSSEKRGEIFRKSILRWVYNMYIFKVNMLRILMILSSFSLLACGSENLAESSTENTPEEKARVAMSAENWDLAIQLYTELITGNSQEYKYHPLLATCYAGRAGIDLLNIVKAQFDGSNSAEGGIFSTIGSFLPQNPTDSQLNDIGSSVSTMAVMPEDHRSESGSYEYSSEAFFQFNLYTVSQSVMFINKFTEKTETGELNAEKLQEMSDSEVEELLGNLAAVAAGDDSLASGVSEALAGINSQSGVSSKEKLIGYIQQTQ